MWWGIGIGAGILYLVLVFTLGIMTLGSGPERRFSRQDLELAQDLARRCATAIRNAAAAGERSVPVSSGRSPGWPE